MTDYRERKHRQKQSLRDQMLCFIFAFVLSLRGAPFINTTPGIYIYGSIHARIRRLFFVAVLPPTPSTVGIGREGAP